MILPHYLLWESRCLRIQLQSSQELREAMWTAKYSSGGFSTSFGQPLPLKRWMCSLRRRGNVRGNLRLKLVQPSSSSLRGSQQLAALIESQSTEKSDLVPIDAQRDAQDEETSSVQRASSPIRSVDKRAHHTVLQHIPDLLHTKSWNLHWSSIWKSWWGPWIFLSRGSTRLDTSRRETRNAAMFHTLPAISKGPSNPSGQSLVR